MENGTFLAVFLYLVVGGAYTRTWHTSYKYYPRFYDILWNIVFLPVTLPVGGVVFLHKQLSKPLKRWG